MNVKIVLNLEAVEQETHLLSLVLLIINEVVFLFSFSGVILDH